ncbi:MAG: peptidoglycan-binding protein [Bacteroidales bacterium]|nr:peptidoglycan-binding protein [Bacteroidales bacterium]MBQ2350852.1 peptidoglycan-binding protein [Bacteroidales bacterium]MBQ2573981.1 peptidoglycan-binding protein [Bacteroidales bacterium]MBQ5423924.1 peptidoglycan-binding protein [Bacteroidales bacterium]MBQ5457721.1 peptidoglycan-binding protein [Bacteroidales bacterium]
MKTKTLVIIIVVIALAIAVYMFRDKIFGKKKSDSDESVEQKFADATAANDTVPAYVAPTAPTTTTTTTAPASNDSSVLQKGSRGENVKKLQKALVDAGFSVGKSGVDGIFGNDTETALKKATGKTSVTVEQLNKFLQAKDNGKTAAAAWQVALALNPITAQAAGLSSLLNLFK